MKLIRKLCAVIMSVAVVISITGCDMHKNTPQEVQTKFDEFCETIVNDLIASDSFNAHYNVTDEADYGVSFEDSDYTLGEFTRESTKEGEDSLEEYYNHLKAFQKEDLTQEQQLTYDVLMEYFEEQIMYNGSYLIQNIMGLNSGIIGNLSTNFIEYQFYDAEDIDHYFMYLEDVPRYMNQVYDYLREQSEEGYFMSDYLVDQIVDQCDGYIDAEVDPLIASFNDKIDAMNLSSEDTKAYESKNEEYVTTYFNPIYTDTRELLLELKGTGTNAGGLCGYGEEGNDLYSAIIRDKTSCDISADELIELLDNEMSNIMKTLIAIASVDYEEYQNSFDYQPDFDTPQEVLEYALDKMKEDFPEPVTTSYNIEYQNKACEVEGSIAYYVTARIDNINVNNIKVNGSAVEDNAMMLYATLTHEGFPGHLYQYTSFYNNQNIPTVRKLLSFIGASEGWAEYASTCTYDYLPVEDSLKTLLELNDMFSYVLSSRIDVGVNYEGWDLDDTYDYLSQYIDVDTDYDSEDNTVASIFYSVVGDPGLMLPYTVGHIYMNELRQEAEDALGSSFNLKEYHQWIVDMGVAPFDVYRSELSSWLTK